MRTKTAAVRQLMLGAGLVLVGCGDAASQGVHPSKQVYANFEQWPAIAPGDVPVANFQPFRINGKRRADIRL